MLILAGGIIFASAPNNLEALIAGRYFNGIAVGLATVPYLVHASELSRTNSRGLCVGVEQFSVSLGIAIQMIAVSQWSPYSDFSVNCLHGILDIILAVFAAGALFFFIESPVDYIRCGDDAGALDALSRLQNPPAVTMTTNSHLEELKMYVREQESFTVVESLQQSFLPLVKMIFFRSMVLAFTYSAVLSNILQVAMLINRVSWTPIVAACIRIFGGCLALMTMDKLGRKITSLLWLVIVGALMVSMNTILMDSMNLLSSHKMSVVTSIWLSMQFFVGLFTPITSTYASEAFPLRTKRVCMAICVIVEQIIQIVVITTCITTVGNYDAFLGMSITLLVAFACLCITMPETKKTSLGEAQKRFAKMFNFRML